MNLSTSVNFEKDSKERLNRISTKLKNYIYQIKTKENAINPEISEYNKYNKYTTITNESKLKTNNKSENSTPYFNKNEDNKKPKFYQTIFYKRMNNYNNIIHEKKNELLNINSLLNKRFQRNNNYGKHTLYSLKIKSSDKNKAKNYFSFDEAYNNSIEKKEINSNYNSIDNDYKHRNINGALSTINWNKRDKRIKKNKMEKLEYAFEIRRLRRKLEKIKKENIEIKDKLNDIKEKNINLEKKILKDGEQKSIINDLILLNKQNALYDNSNGLDFKSDNQSKKDNINGNDSIDDLILNIMDIKYYYENSLLTNEFISGVNRLLYGISFFKNGNKNSQNLIKSINELIKIKNNSTYINNKYKNLLQDNYNYYSFLTDLMKKLNLKDFSELDKLIKNIYLNLKENEQIKKTQNILVKGFSFTHRNNEKNNLYGSSNLIFNNKNNNKIKYYTKLQNYINTKNSISLSKQKTSINHIDKKRKKNLDNYLSQTQTEKIDFLNKNNTVRNKNDNFININNYYQTFYNKNNSYEDKKEKKINLNYLDKDIKINKINKNNNLINNEKSNDFKYNNHIDYAIGKTYIKNDELLYNHDKNHSKYLKTDI